METKKWYQKMPHVCILLLFIIIICAVLTYIIPAGEFDREQIEGTSRAVVVAGSYHPVEQAPVSFMTTFKSLTKGFQATANIIAMILFSSGAFKVMIEAGMVENLLGSLLGKVSKRSNSGPLVIWIVTFVFSVIGIFIGPEVHVPFTVVTVAIALAMGYDLIVGMAMVLGGSIGFATAPINASTIGTSDAICGLPLFSGMALRTCLWFCATCVTCLIITHYAETVRKTPERSYAKGIDTTGLSFKKDVSECHMQGRDWGVLACLIGIFAFTVIGCTQWGWYIDEMTTVFILGGIAAGIVAGFSGNKIVECFIEGAKDGFQIAVRIIPYLIAILVSIGVFRASGAMDWLVEEMKWLISLVGIDTQWVGALPTALMKPLSGGGARGMMVDAMTTFGADSFVGRLSCIFQGSTDTTFYILAVYFGSVGVTRTRHAVACGLLADLAGVIAAILLCYLFF